MVWVMAWVSVTGKSLGSGEGPQPLCHVSSDEGGFCSAWDFKPGIVQRMLVLPGRTGALAVGRN